MSSSAENLKKKFSVLLPALNEKQRRLLLGAEALSLGYGGIGQLAEITGVSPHTIRRGMQEVRNGEVTVKRVRASGGGRKKLSDREPEVRRIIEDIIEPDSRADPGSALQWTCKSVRNIADLLKHSGYAVSHQTVASILHGMEFSLQGNRKTKEGEDHPNRDKQFRFINRCANEFLRHKDPVISVDTKKKELVGNHENGGSEWRPKGNPIDVNGHDFPDPKVPKAIPYGIYDLADNSGWVSVGITADTAEFAVSSIKHWWTSVGRRRYPQSSKILICADAGGSNGYRSHLWKRELQRFADARHLEISVCHFPPGTSKWNKIEHRLFSFITMNWRGKPLRTYKIIIDLIASTKTKTGLIVKALIDKKHYQKGIKVPKAELKDLNICRNAFQGEWNYTIKPRV